MNAESIVDTIVDRMLGAQADNPKHSEAQQKFRNDVAEFLNVIDPRRGRRLGGDVLRLLSKEFRDYAQILDPKGDDINLKAYTDQLDRVIRGKVCEALLEMMELMAGDRLATMGARKLMADHLATYGEVPEHLKPFAWPSEAKH